MQEFMILPIGWVKLQGRLESSDLRLFARPDIIPMNISPDGLCWFLCRAATFSEALRMGSEVYHTLKGIIKSKYGTCAEVAKARDLRSWVTLHTSDWKNYAQNGF
jgi:hypothetical protein